MSALSAIILSIIQGLTEFLPISSSAHLVFAQELLRIAHHLRLNYDVILHLGTTLALLIFFFRRIVQIITSVFARDERQRQTARWIIFYIIIGSIPIAIIGLLFKDRIELTFAKPIFPALFLIVTAVLLFATKLVKSPRSQLKLRSAILIGIAQAIGLLPGISRSGATIATALLLGINHAEAFEFSFLLSIPAVIGANILTMKEFTNIPLPIAIISIIITALTGLLALFILKNLVRQGKLYYFGFYCILLSVFALIIF